MPNRIHLVCRAATRHGYTQQGNIFTTSSWRIADSAANSVQTLALHNCKHDPSWAQGTVISRTKVGGRWIFTAQMSDNTYTWPTPPTRGPEKAYV
jgi:hypothetical protein